ERTSGSVTDEVPRQPEQKERAEQGYVVDPLVGSHWRARDRRECFLRDLWRVGLGDEDALHATGQVGRTLDQAGRDHGQGEGGEREVEGGEAQRRKAKQKTDDARE